MYKVMVVDDEKLVRKGILTTFPWRKHGFEVVFDAGSGEKALELLQNEEIDLLVTDLAMNGMSGLELIRRTKQLRQELPVVILTCHDNFKYIQEAMRLGVLDYIVKTEIEDEVVDETLGRIAAQLGSRDPRSMTASESRQDGMLLCGPSRTSTLFEWMERDEFDRWVGRSTELSAATWLFRLPNGEAERMAARIRQDVQSGWTCIRITGLEAENDGATMAKLRNYRQRELFYRPAEPIKDMDWSDLPDEPETADEDAIALLSDEWNEPGWIYDDGRFESLLRRTAETGSCAEELRGMLYPVAMEWKRLLAAAALKDVSGSMDEWLFWRDWENGLRGFRGEIRRIVELNASRQSADAVLRAVERLRTEPDLEASEADIARSVNMSRGHFSKTFKKVTGKSYGEYVRLLRMERAKEMILRTDESITRVAELSGFSDYRHFSRIFREYTGMLPTDFRKTADRKSVSTTDV